MMAPSSADMTDTIINVNAHPSSPAASETRKIKYGTIREVISFVTLTDSVFLMEFVCV